MKCLYIFMLLLYKLVIYIYLDRILVKCRRRQPNSSIKSKCTKFVQILKSAHFKIHNFLWAPVTTFWYNVMFYLLFLALFSYTLVVRFDPKIIEWNEILLSVWVAGLLTEWCDQVCSKNFLNI